jgi:hypothetical protein
MAVVRRKHPVDSVVASVDFNGWKGVILEADFKIPTDVPDPVAFVTREKMHRYVDNHPLRIYHYNVGDHHHTVDCKGGDWFINKKMHGDKADPADVSAALNIARQFRSYTGLISEQTKRTNGFIKQQDILAPRAEELLDKFGSLHTVDEVHRMIVKEWGYVISKHAVLVFYQKNLKEIDKLRDHYMMDYSDVSLSKKRSRLDKLSIMFYTYFQKWSDDPRLDYSKELRGIIEQIKKEVEGEQININVNGQINVDMTIEVNKTLYETSKRIPINNLIVAMVSAKRGMDPTKLMTQLTTSYYKSLTGFGRYEPELQLVHPVDLTYNWNEIEQLHRMKDKSVDIEDARIVESTGKVETDALVLRSKSRLLELLNRDKDINDARKSK